jgi:hypothetical protein
MNSASFLIFCKFIDDGLIRAETCREYRSYLIKYFVNCCETEGIIIYRQYNVYDINATSYSHVHLVENCQNELVNFSFSLHISF